MNYSVNLPAQPVGTICRSTALFTGMIGGESLLLLLAIEALCPKLFDLPSDGLDDTFHTLHFQHLQTLDFILELQRHHRHY